MKVADLFCGAGGISEGFRLAGAEIVYGLDHDKAAVETFQRNHPNASVERIDAVALNAKMLPDFDVLVGGPPCVNFSLAKGRNANILEGLRLVQAFLRIVYERKPRYWIMENVPRIALHLPNSIPLAWIGIDKKGELHVPFKTQFNVADFGVPQLRRRYLIGNYPKPSPTHGDAEKEGLLLASDGRKPWKTLGSVISQLPDPTKKRKKGVVQDPNYDLAVSIDVLSDHFHDAIMSPEDVLAIRNAKNNHPYMGFMPFPDNLNKPARTVVALQMGRETLVIEFKKSSNVGYRRATVRECATLQSFPITYQFWGNSLNARYRLAGDAVPPLFVYCIAREIFAKMHEKANNQPVPATIQLALSPAVKFRTRLKSKTTFPADRSFKQMIPGKEVRGCRAQLENIICNKNGSMSVHWCARLYVGEGSQNTKSDVIGLREALNELARICRSADSVEAKAVSHFLMDLENSLSGKIPESATLQAIHSGRKVGSPSPHDIASALAGLVNKHFPRDQFVHVRVPRSGAIDIIGPRGVPLRIAAGLVAASYASELTNIDAKLREAHADSKKEKIQESKAAKLMQLFVEHLEAKADILNSKLS